MEIKHTYPEPVIKIARKLIETPYSFYDCIQTACEEIDSILFIANKLGYTLIKKGKTNDRS
jgi:hypothetical protein